MKVTSIGMLLLAIYLILAGLMLLLNLHFEGERFVTGGLAVAAGVCLLINK